MASFMMGQMDGIRYLRDPVRAGDGELPICRYLSGQLEGYSQTDSESGTSLRRVPAAEQSVTTGMNWFDPARCRLSPCLGWERFMAARYSPAPVSAPTGRRTGKISSRVSDLLV